MGPAPDLSRGNRPAETRDRRREKRIAKNESVEDGDETRLEEEKGKTKGTNEGQTDVYLSEQW